jgi:hypothetical protein
MRGLLILSFLALAGCPSDDTASDGSIDSSAGDAITVDSSGTSGPRVELGTGRANFVEIPETGATMELIAGPQGGWHLEVSARLYDLTVEDLLLSYRIEQGGEMISMPVMYLLSESRLVRDGDRWLRQGDIAVFDITGPEDVVGEMVDVFVVAEPPDGPAVMDSRLNVLVVDEEP